MKILQALRPPDILSLLNAVLGFGAVAGLGWWGYQTSILLIFAAAIADGLDGFLARRFGAGALGPDLDSLADLISFGAAPCAAALAASGPSWPAVGIAVLYMACGMLRLARFNVSPRSDVCFEGLPITASGVAVAGSLLVGSLPLTFVLMAALALLMASSLPYPKFRDPRAVGLLVAILSASGVMVLLGRVDISAALIFLAMIGYLSSPLVMPCLLRRR